MLTTVLSAAIVIGGSVPVIQTIDNISYTDPHIIIDSSSFTSASDISVNKAESDTRLFQNISHVKTKYDETSGELLSYVDLEDDWDGYGGVAPQKETVFSCSELLSVLNKKNIPLPKAMLSGDGEVSLYWTDKKSDVHIEIGFEEEGLYSYLISTPSLITGADDCRLDEEIPVLLLEHISFFNFQDNSKVA